MKLSNRLEMVVSFVKPGESAADVGTDHGHVPVELVRRGIVKRAYAMDVRKGPLSKAEENIAAARMKDKIETRLSDGVQKLSAGEAESVIIAGMGGELVIHIMEEGRHVWDMVEQWVLSPHSELHKVREWLEKNGFKIVKEDMLFEEGKYYTVMDVRKADIQDAMNHAHEDESVFEKRYRYGTYLKETKNQVFLDFLKDEEAKLLTLKQNLEKQAVQSERAKESLKEVEDKLSLNREVQNEM
ncbi:MAG: SAM-dependent methyltransferase [Lachnospiraceae bacterium]|nr:SAM-dependent methyltransferase [Lachnospiraceae bacterium]